MYAPRHPGMVVRHMQYEYFAGKAHGKTGPGEDQSCNRTDKKEPDICLAAKASQGLQTDCQDNKKAARQNGCSQ